MGEKKQLIIMFLWGGGGGGGGGGGCLSLLLTNKPNYDPNPSKAYMNFKSEENDQCTYSPLILPDA